MFGKKQSKRMLIRKVLDHAINFKKNLYQRKGKFIPYPEKREKK